jgi:hypothetical protein
MPSTIGEFITFYPEFQNKEQATLQLALRMSLIVCPVERWLKDFNIPDEDINLLVYLHTAHLIAGSFFQVTEIAGNAGAIASGSPAPFPASKGEDDLSLTFYGQTFKRMRSMLVPATGFCL